jgi:hypothetical protein
VRLGAGALAAFLAGSALGCVPATPPRGAAPSASAPPAAGPTGEVRMLVFYPPGACGGELEVEVFDRAAHAWLPHPEHPRLAPGACAAELAWRLLNELRVRCADPAGRRLPSPWVVGAELAASAAPCAGTPRP